MTQEGASQRIGKTSGSDWSRWESGHPIRRNLVDRIAAAFNVAPHQIAPELASAQSRETTAPGKGITEDIAPYGPPGNPDVTVLQKEIWQIKRDLVLLKGRLDLQKAEIEKLKAGQQKAD